MCPALSARRCTLPPRFCKILQRWGRVCPRPSPSLGCPLYLFIYLDMCISRSHAGDGHAVRPFLCCVSDVPPSLCSPRPPARRSVAGGRSLSVTHPPLPCVLSGEGFLLRSRACAGLLFANTPYIHLVPVLPENSLITQLSSQEGRTEARTKGASL